MTSETPATPPEGTPEAAEPSFAELLSDFNRTRPRAADTPGQISATVVSLSADQVFLDIGYKSEGVLPRSAFPENAAAVQPGERFLVSSRGRNEEGFYDLSLRKAAVVTDWGSLEAAFAAQSTIAGTVTAQVKGGFSVDLGVRAFMPASRSGVRDAAEMEPLVGQQIECRILKLDAAEEDVVVDRRAVLEEQALTREAGRFAALREGDLVTGTVRSLAAYGAFVDLGGIDGLLHISDLAWSRVENPADLLTIGQQLELKVLKIDPAAKRISLGLKQLQPEPWATATDRYTPGERVSGTVTRLTDFGAFVELEPGIEGLIHVSEMSWIKKVRTPSDLLSPGDTVEAVILSIAPAERRIALGLKQALGDPWTDVPLRFPVGSTIAGPVTRLTKFGAFIQLAEGIEGLVHISEIVADKRLNHPQEALRAGEQVKAQVLALDPEKRQIKLSIKQLIPTGLDEYLTEHHIGDLVSGRIVTQTADTGTVELGEGVRATYRPAAPVEADAPAPAASGVLDLSSLGSLLNARWKGTAPKSATPPAPARAGQIATFRITALDRDTRTIEVEPA